MTNEPKLGQLVGAHEEAHRDAVHIAVVPVVAKNRLLPGAHVCVDAGVAFLGKNPLGVVDPYLRRPVEAGERFYLFLYPRTVTSLRHVWTHPAFLSEEAEATVNMLSASDSVTWLKEVASRFQIDYEELVHRAATGGGVTFGTESYRDMFDDAKEEGAFWHHLEIVTGQHYSDAHRSNTFFSCSC